MNQPKVPIHWAGFFRNGVFTCGACPDADLCVEKGVCQRARPEDLYRDLGGYGWRRSQGGEDG